MSSPLKSVQQFESEAISAKGSNVARIYPFKTASNQVAVDWLPSLAGDFVLGDFKFRPQRSDKKLVDYLLIGVLSIVIHSSVIDHFNKSSFEPEELVKPAKEPSKVQISFVKPQPKPVIQPPPPPPPPKVVALKKPPKPKIKPKPVQKIVEPPPVQQSVVTQSNAPVTPAPAPVAAPPPVVEKVTEPRAGADYLHNPAPEYPEIAIERGWEGKVLVKVHVKPDGNPDTVKVAKSSGKPVLDDAAVKTVKRWSFVPAKRGNTPIAGWVTVPISFNL